MAVILTPQNRISFVQYVASIEVAQTYTYYGIVDTLARVALVNVDIFPIDSNPNIFTVEFDPPTMTPGAHVFTVEAENSDGVSDRALPFYVSFIS